MNFVRDYAIQVTRVMEAVWQEEQERIDQAGELLSQTLLRDGLLYVFGCGHSHMLEEELFYRAGGLGAVCPVFDSATMLHEGAAKSSRIERMSGQAQLLIERYEMGPQDCFLAVSSSGINPYIIEMAQLARERGTKVIGISSFQYLTKASRHKDALHLPDICHVCVDNHVPVGDATVEVCEDGTKAGPVSSLASMAIANAIVLAACQKLREKGEDPQVFRSGNCEGGDEYNARLIRCFSRRVRNL